MSFLHDAWSSIQPFLHEYGLLTLFLIIYFESLGAPLPGERPRQRFAARIPRRVEHRQRLFVVWVAAVAGDFTGYLIGHYGGRPLLEKHGWMVRLTPERLHKFEEIFRVRGPIIVVTARFFILLRQLNGLIAGSMGMPWARFLIANIIGAALWTAVWGLGPYFFGDFVGRGFTALRSLF